MKKRNLLVYLLTGCVLTASMSVGTMATVHAETETTSAAAVEPGTNMYAAGELTLNTPVSGTSENANDCHWYSFTTGASGTEYQITCLNRSSGALQVYFNVYDEMGTVLYEGEAFQGGVPSVITAGDLEADTTYYISVVSPNSSASRDYTLTVKDPTAPAPEIVSTGEELVPGDSMYTAGSIPLGKKASGTTESEEDYHWYSFTTEAEAGVEYQISCVNATPNTNQVYFGIYDANSEALYSGEALSDGKPSIILASDLQPDTTYYIRVVSAGSAAAKDYILMVKAPKADDKKAAPADGTAAAEEQTQGAAAEDTEAFAEAAAE